MIRLISRYTRWLHCRWPAGVVERLPEAREDGSTNVPGLYIVGDLTGIPLLKFSSHTGARAVRSIMDDASFTSRSAEAGVRDVVIIGAGVSGMAAALEARKNDLDYELLEATEAFSTITNFPKGKPIFTYPTDMTPDGDLQFPADGDVKEALVKNLHRDTLEKGVIPTSARAEQVNRSGNLLEVKLAGGDVLRAHRVIVGIGRSGNFRKLGVPGEELGKVSNRLHDPKDYAGQDVLVVGGGDSALETAIALTRCGANVTFSYRKPDFSRPKPENIEHIQQLAADPSADVVVEQPSSERVTTASYGSGSSHCLALVALPPLPSVETLASKIEVQARLKPASTEPVRFLPERSSSLVRSKMRMLASTAMPTERMNAAMPASVRVMGTNSKMASASTP